MFKKVLRGWLIAVLLACLVPAGAMAATVYFNDFDGGLTVDPGVTAVLSGITTTTGVQGYAGLGPVGNQFGGNFLINTTNAPQATTLTLTGLPSHTSVNVNFLLAAIDSWDGSNGSPAPDYLNVMVAGTSVFQHTFASASGSSDYSPPAGVLLSSASNLGFWIYNESAFNMNLEPAFQNIAHTGSSLTIDWFASGAGWQGAYDESWAIDNVQVVLNNNNVVPLPPTVVLLGSGLLGLLGAGWRLRKP